MENIFNAEITGTKLYFEDHGCLTFDIFTEHERGCQSFGGYCVGYGNTNYKSIDEITGTKKGTEAMARIMWVVGSDSWEGLKGMHCRIKWDDRQRICAIGNIIKDRWFDLQEYMAEKDTNI